jgi:FkbM family methyltransferase
MIINIKTIAKLYNIKIYGVVHIGLHEGDEILKYIFMGVKNIIGFEANRNVFKKLKKKNIYNLIPWLKLEFVNIAISDKKGVADFFITSNDLSSSLLKLKKHKQIYPEITEVNSEKVNTDTLNNFFENSYNIDDYNFLNMDIQGAELMALKGATKILDKIDIINVELNFDELYENCALSSEIDDFLLNYSFVRVCTNKKFHPTWGDGLYVKKNFIKDKLVL